MGLWDWLAGSGWATKSPRLRDAEANFSEEELQRLRQLFQQHGCTDYTSPIDDDTFLRQMCGLGHASSDLTAGLLHALRRCSPTQQLTPEAVTIAKARLERSGDEASQQLCFEILSGGGGGGGEVARAHLERLISGCLQLVAYQNGLPAPKAAAEAAVAALASGALQAAAPSSSISASAPAPEALGPDGYTRWCKSQPAVQHLLSSLLRAVGQPPPASPPNQPAAALPAAALPAFVSAGRSRGPCSAAIALRLPCIASVLPARRLCPALRIGSPAAGRHPQRRRRRLLGRLPAGAVLGVGAVALPAAGPAAGVAAAVHLGAARHELQHAGGQAERRRPHAAAHQRQAGALRCRLPWQQPRLAAGWRRPRASCTRGRADAQARLAQGQLFGGVASQPWQKRGTFYGDFGSFVLSLLPRAAVYHATGINQNFQW
jgi:hypothetical protein